MVTWRREARVRLARLVDELGGVDVVSLKASLMAAYPWGARRRYPYLVWREEVQRLVGEVRASVRDVDKLKRWNEAVR